MRVRATLVRMLDGPWWYAEQPSVLGFRHTIAVARHSFERSPIQDCDLTGLTRNSPFLLKALQGRDHALSLHTQHLGDGHLGSGQCVPVHPVMAHQQPTRETLFD